MSNETSDVKETPETPETAQQQGVELTINDLKTIHQIIDAASQRGAFRASEFAAVGEVYNRLTAFLEFATKKGQ